MGKKKGKNGGLTAYPIGCSNPSPVIKKLSFIRKGGVKGWGQAFYFDIPLTPPILMPILSLLLVFSRIFSPRINHSDPYSAIPRPGLLHKLPHALMLLPLAGGPTGIYCRMRWQQKEPSLGRLGEKKCQGVVTGKERKRRYPNKAGISMSCLSFWRPLRP